MKRILWAILAVMLCLSGCSGGTKPSDIPDPESATFNFESAEDCLALFLNENHPDHAAVQALKASSRGGFVEQIEGIRALPKPYLDDIPMPYRNQEGFSNVTFMTSEAYDMPWIWYHCVVNGESVTVKLTYPECAGGEIKSPQTCAELLESIAPDAVNVDNYKKYPNYKNVYEKTITVTSRDTSALFYELSDSEDITVMFCYNDVLVSLSGKASVMSEALWEAFSIAF